MGLKGRWVAVAAPVVGRGVLRLLGATCRSAYVDWDTAAVVTNTDRPVIYAFWHSRLLTMFFPRRHRRRQIVLLVSPSRDGEIIRKVLASFGYRTVSGSSARGGHQALRVMAKALTGGDDMAITPDGPRGPAEKVKLGILLLAKMTGAAIVPVACGARPGWRAGSWDRLLVPLPFARLRYVAGEPIIVPADTDDLDPWRLRLEAELGRVTDLADRPG